jgi:Ran GTPase-activating protein (RanGAP) involved in mRNA processing and transport
LQAKDPSLISFDVSSYDGAKYFDDTAVTILAHALHGNESVTHMNLANNTFESDGAKALADWLATNPPLVELSLAGNSIGDLGVEYLSAALQKNTHLAKLNLANNGIGDRGVEYLLDALKFNDALQVLVILSEKNDIAMPLYSQLEDAVALNSQPIAFKRILKRIQDDDPSVTRVNFSQYDGERYYNDVSCRILAVALRDNRHLGEIDLSNNKITSKGAQYLSDALEENKGLKELALNNNLVDDEGARALITALRHNNQLQRLWLMNNNISDEVQNELDYAIMLNNQPRLLKKVIEQVHLNDGKVRSLDFSTSTPEATKMEDDSVRLLAEGLIHNTCVTSLNLRNNRITAVGAACLADVLRVNHTIGKIDLRGNPIRTDGARVLAKALAHNTSVTTLNLDPAGIDADTLETIEAALHVNGEPLGVTRRTPSPDVGAEADGSPLPQIAYRGRY